MSSRLIARGRARGAALGVLAALVAAAAVLAPGAAAQQDSGAEGGSFSDVAGGVHKPAVDALDARGLFAGTLCDDAGFCPTEPIQRSTMAVWLIRAVEDGGPPEVQDSRFADVSAGEWWSDHAERLAQLEITVGCSQDPLRYCPQQPVTRAQMASFLTRAFKLEPAQSAGFADVDDDSSHIDNINALAAAAITVGCSQDPLRYCPQRPVTRAQMATFLARALGLTPTPPTTPPDTSTQPAPTHQTVAAGGSHSCAVKADDSITCWGNNEYGQATAPTTGTYKALTAGRDHSCALKTDNTITCWGNNEYGQADAPEGTYQAVTAGFGHSCAVKADDTIACWGNNEYGQADALAGEYQAVTAGGYHSCAVKADDTIACWGDNYSGRATAPAGEYQTVTSGSEHSCAVKADDTIACWGANYYGKATAPAGEYQTVTAGHNHSCALTTDDTITCWGANYYGQTDEPAGEYRAVTAGVLHSCAVKTDDTIACWGYNEYGQADAPAGELNVVTLNVVTVDEVSVALTAAATPGGTALDLVIEFAEPVVGFTVDDLRVSNGVASSFGGSGAVYLVRVTRAAPGSIVVRIPRGAALDRATGAADSSPALALLTVARPVSDTRWGLDTWDRDLVLAGHLAEFGRDEPAAGFTGDIETCVAGTTSQSYRDSMFQRINWYRRMAGLATVTENLASSSAAQHASLMMAAEGGLSHYPGPEWACYTPEGDAAAGKSNLTLGASGLSAIDVYMQDPGDNNRSVGHRRWILYPTTQQMGVGDVRSSWSDNNWSSNALYVTDDGNSASGRHGVREERRFVSWPSAGFVRAETVWGRWSFQMVQQWGDADHPDFRVADLSGASVQMLDDEGPVEVRVIDRGSAHIVWAVDGYANSAQFDEPTGGDHCYDITVSGVRVDGDVQTPYEYATCILDTDWTASWSNSPPAPPGAPRGSDTFDDVAAGHYADEAIG